MGPDPAVGGLDEGEGEGVERLFRAQPDVFVGPDIDIDAEDLRVVIADPAVQAVGGDNDVGGQGADVGDLILEPKLDTERAGALLQDGQQPLPADAREAMSARADGLAVDMDVDVVPMDEGRLDDGRGLGIVGLEIGERLVGKTTPQPKVSSGRLRSWTTTSSDGSRSFREMARYRPPGPAPTTAMLLTALFIDIF